MYIMKLIINEIDNNMLNRTLLVCPSFCGKTHLLLNKVQLFRLDNPLRQIRFHYEES